MAHREARCEMDSESRCARVRNDNSDRVLCRSGRRWKISDSVGQWNVEGRKEDGQKESE
jgi:hypothetical protein